MNGKVIAVQANFYKVAVEGIAQTLLCTRRAILKKMGQTVWVGDCVQVEKIYGDRAVITGVQPRLNYLPRPAIANLQGILVVAALAEPEPDPWQISRFLVHGETCGVPVWVGLSKADLVSPEVIQQWQDRLHSWGYTAIPFSTFTKTGIEALVCSLPKGITLLTGLSGVGKSSLINTLNPNLHIPTGAVAEHSKTGRHTTRHVALFPIASDRYLADSPGFLQPDLHLHPQQLAQYFPEIRQILSQQQCLFPDCLHEQEPDCVVRGNWERYEHYLTWLAELRQSPAPPAPVLQVKTKPPKGNKQRQEVLLGRRQLTRRTANVLLDRQLAEEL
ncbi:MAG: ribosome small subunit-dependent GTPase A [Pseudanabaenaceae cyanobacterium]